MPRPWSRAPQLVQVPIASPRRLIRFNRCQHTVSARRCNKSSWAAAVSAQHIVTSDYGSPTKADPLRAVAKELKFMSKNLRNLIGSGHPILDRVAKYYTQTEGKHLRPSLVLLMSRATALSPKATPEHADTQSYLVDHPISPANILSDSVPPSTTPDLTPLTSPSHDAAYMARDSDILPTQRRLAEIVELIHTASLMHDDVLDDSESRRSSPSANIAFGNKMAVLAGDFLLGRASIALARLRHPEVIELMATTIANLIEGEFMQLQNTAHGEEEPSWTEDTVAYYLRKTYLKSASLISKSCRSAALLNGSCSDAVDAAYAYGKNIGLAFQLVDDLLDYTISAEELGKPAGADLELGLATAPLLFAWKENEELGALVGRKFSKEGDVQTAREIVARSSGLEQTRALAQQYVDNAIDALEGFPDSDAKCGLTGMCLKVMQRRKIPVAKRLRRAILLNDVLLVQRIVRSHPESLRNPDYEDKSNTSLHLAAKLGHVEIVDFLVHAGHEDDGVSRNIDWYTPLMLAMEAGHVEVGRVLHAAFPQCVPWKSKKGMDALMLASRTTDSISLIPQLLASPHPASPHAHDSDGNTALHHASAAGELKALRMLLQAGASPSAQNAFSWTPIAYSATVAAEVYFKNLVAEVDRWRAGGGGGSGAGGAALAAAGRSAVGPTAGTDVAGSNARRPTGGAVRLVTEDVITAPNREWSPVLENRRAMTPTAGRPERIIDEGFARSRARSGD